MSGARREEWGAGWEGCEMRRRRIAEGARGESERRAHHEFREVRSDKQTPLARVLLLSQSGESTEAPKALLSRLFFTEEPLTSTQT